MNIKKVIVSYKWTADELIKAQKYHARSQCRKVFRLLINTSLLLLILGSIFLTVFIEVELLVVLAGLFGVYSLFLRPSVNRFLQRRKFSKRPDQDILVEWNITSEILRSNCDLGMSEFAWSAIRKIVISPEGILVYMNDQVFHWLPRKGFSSESDYDTFEVMALEHDIAVIKVA